MLEPLILPPPQKKNPWLSPFHPNPTGHAGRRLWGRKQLMLLMMMNFSFIATKNWEDEHSFSPGAVTLFLQSVCQTETDLSSGIKTDHLSAAAPGFKIGLSWREKGAQPIAHVRLHTWVICDMIILSERVCPYAELTSGIPIFKNK